jgi:hypothetical protein
MARIPSVPTQPYISLRFGLTFDHAAVGPFLVSSPSIRSQIARCTISPGRRKLSVPQADHDLRRSATGRAPRGGAEDADRQFVPERARTEVALGPRAASSIKGPSMSPS